MEIITQELKDAVGHATPTDIGFVRTRIAAHSLRKETKVGFRANRVFDVSIPASLPVSFVQAESDAGQYWYVVSGIGERAGRRREYLVNSISEARAAVLQELRLGLSSPPGNLRSPRG